MAPSHPLRSLTPALAFAALLALASCGAAPAGPEPSASEATTAPATPDPRPTPASSTAPARNIPVPELPEAAKANTKEGFKAFVEHYIALLDYAYQTGDTKPALEAAHSGCTMCNTVTGDVTKTYATGGWMVGGDLTLESYASDGIPDMHQVWFALIEVRQLPFTDFSSEGIGGSNDGGAATVGASGLFKDGVWKMWDLGTVAGSRQ